MVCIQFRHLIPAPVDRTSASARLVAQTPKIDNMSENKHINDPHGLRTKAVFSCEVIHASIGWQSVEQSCILPTYLVQELNAGTLGLWFVGGDPQWPSGY